MPFQSYPSWRCHSTSNYTWRRVQVTKLLIMQSCWTWGWTNCSVWKALHSKLCQVIDSPEVFRDSASPPRNKLSLDFLPHLFQFLFHCHPKFDAINSKKVLHSVISFDSEWHTVLKTKGKSTTLHGFTFHNTVKGKGKAIPVTGHEGPFGCKMPRFLHFLYNRLTDGSKIVSLTRRSPFTPQQNSCYSFQLEAESTPGP
jgi:hypothetical protein